MSPYKHLTINERAQIFLMISVGINISKIAVRLSRSKSTISRELQRNNLTAYSPNGDQMSRAVE